MGRRRFTPTASSPGPLFSPTYLGNILTVSNLEADRSRGSTRLV